MRSCVRVRGNVGIKPATTSLINRFGFRTVLIAATAGTTVAVAVLGFTSAATPIAVIAGLSLISGVTRSVGFTVYSTVGLADMPSDLMRDANTLAATSTGSSPAAWRSRSPRWHCASAAPSGRA